MLDLSGIVEDSIVDGPGLRVTVFCQGCPHRCDGCHNPETWEYGCGTPMEEEAVFQIIRSNPMCRGVTFSGGEPFTQAEGFTKLAKLLKVAHYEVASYTGYTWEQLLRGTAAQRELLENIDVLIDGAFILSEKTLELPFRGSRNQRIIDVKKSLSQGSVSEIITGRWVGDY